MYFTLGEMMDKGHHEKADAYFNIALVWVKANREDVLKSVFLGSHRLWLNWE